MQQHALPPGRSACSSPPHATTPPQEVVTESYAIQQQWWQQQQQQEAGTSKQGQHHQPGSPAAHPGVLSHRHCCSWPGRNTRQLSCQPVAPNTADSRAAGPTQQHRRRGSSEHPAATPTAAHRHWDAAAAAAARTSRMVVWPTRLAPALRSSPGYWLCARGWAAVRSRPAAAAAQVRGCRHLVQAAPKRATAAGVHLLSQATRGVHSMQKRVCSDHTATTAVTPPAGTPCCRVQQAPCGPQPMQQCAWQHLRWPPSRRPLS